MDLLEVTPAHNGINKRSALILSHHRAKLDRANALCHPCSVQRVLVPLMIFASGAFMAVAWLGHLRIKDRGFWVALGLSWLIVLPEYVLNVLATRYGYGTFTGAQMASFHLCSGVVCVALVSKLVLGEQLGAQQIIGFFFLAIGMIFLLRT